MKTLADLEAIRKQMLDKVTMRKEDETEFALLWVWLPAELRPVHVRL